MKTTNWYDMIETGIPSYPKFHLTHRNGSKGYTLMVLSFDVEKGIADGWFFALERPTLKEARKATKEWFN
jgi:hypothetical protein